MRCVQAKLWGTESGKEETDLSVECLDKVLKIKHAFSHFKITLHVFECKYIKGKAKALRSQMVEWVELNDLTRFVFPTSNKKIIHY